MLPALEKGRIKGLKIIGRPILLGDFTNFSWEGISLDYYDLTRASQVFLPSDSSSEEEDFSDENEEFFSDDEGSSSSSTVGKICSTLSGYIPGGVKEVVNEGIKSIGNHLETFFDDEELETENFGKLQDLFKLELTALQEKLQGLENQHNEETKKQIEELEQKQSKLEEALKPLQDYWIQKQNEAEERARIAEDPSLNMYYKALLTDISGVFQTLLVLRSKLIAPDSGAATHTAARASHSAHVVETVHQTAEYAENVAVPALEFIEPLTSFLSSTTSTASSVLHCLRPVTDALPVINIATGGASLVAKCFVGIFDNLKIRDARDALIELTPRGIEKFTDQLSRKMTFSYREQISLLTEGGAKRFAECGALRLLVLLLNGYQVEKDNLIQGIVNAIGATEICINELEIPWIKKKISISQYLWHEKLEVRDPRDQGVTQDMLYRKPGRCLVRGKQHYYYSNDEKLLSERNKRKLIRPFPKNPKTDAKKVGYIYIEEASALPQYMSPDSKRLGPRSALDISKEKEERRRTVQAKKKTAQVQAKHAKEMSKAAEEKSNDGVLLERIRQLEEENGQLKEEVSMISAAILEIFESAFEKVYSSGQPGNIYVNNLKTNHTLIEFKRKKEEREKRDFKRISKKSNEKARDSNRDLKKSKGKEKEKESDI